MWPKCRWAHFCFMCCSGRQANMLHVDAMMTLFSLRPQCMPRLIQQSMARNPEGSLHLPTCSMYNDMWECTCILTRPNNCTGCLIAPDESHSPLKKALLPTCRQLLETDVAANCVCKKQDTSPQTTSIQKLQVDHVGWPQLQCEVDTWHAALLL